jgi:hypothetical protein
MDPLHYNHLQLFLHKSCHIILHNLIICVAAAQALKATKACIKCAPMHIPALFLHTTQGHDVMFVMDM